MTVGRSKTNGNAFGKLEVNCDLFVFLRSRIKFRRRRLVAELAAGSRVESSTDVFNGQSLAERIGEENAQWVIDGACEEIPTFFGWRPRNHDRRFRHAGADRDGPAGVGKAI
jgi:hypothetical protein